MQVRASYFVLAATAFVAACGSDRAPPIDVRMIGSVVGEIKEEVGIYQAYVQGQRPAPGAPIPAAPAGMVCGRGLVDFDITSVKVALTTQAVGTTSADIKLVIPLDPSGVNTLTPTGSGKDVTTNSQTLTFDIFPKLPVSYTIAPNEDFTKRPVAFTLLNLRNALRDAAYKLPCFSTVHDAAKDDPDTFEIGFEVVRTGGGGIALKLAVVEASYSREREVTRGNKITVSFRPYTPPTSKQPIPGKSAGGDDWHTFSETLPRGLLDQQLRRAPRRPPQQIQSVPEPEI